MMNRYHRVVEDFSEDYFILPDIDIEPYSGEGVAIADDLYLCLSQYVAAPLVKLPTGHHWLEVEWGIPADTIAVPSDLEAPEDAPLLTKDHATKALLHQGVVDQP